MKTGDIILIPFPFAQSTNVKVRPAVVIAQTNDQYKDIILAAISSVIPKTISVNEIVIESNETNKLRTKSVIKVDRIVTLKKGDMIAQLGKLSKFELTTFKNIF